MESISSEISGKIKNAIRARLVEMDVYVDDELPDYIMVLVANKKTNAQMEEDLSLFLGSHTKSFVEWIREVFTKLKSLESGKSSEIANEKVKKPKKIKQGGSSEAASVDSKTANTSNVSKKGMMVSKTGSKTELIKVSSTVKSKRSHSKLETSIEPDTKKTSKTAVTKTTGKSAEGVSKKKVQLNETVPTKCPDKVTNKKKVPEVVQDKSKSHSKQKSARNPKTATVKRKASSDDTVLSAVSSESTAPVSVEQAGENKHPRIEPPSRPLNAVSVAAADTEDVLTLTADDDEILTRGRSDVTAPATSKRKEPCGASKSHIEEPTRKAPRNTDTHYSGRESSRDSAADAKPRRRAVLSTVGAVVSRQEPEHDFDPGKPAVGSVASTVRVSERRRLPVRLQPKPTLLLKAMRDAQKSTVASVRPFLVRETRPAVANVAERRGDLRGRLKLGDSSSSSLTSEQASVVPVKRSEPGSNTRTADKAMRISITLKNNRKQVDISEPSIDTAVAATVKPTTTVAAKLTSTRESPCKSVKQALGEIHAELSDDEDGVHVTIGDVQTSAAAAVDDVSVDKTDATDGRAVESLPEDYLSSLVHQAAATVGETSPAFVVTLTGLGAKHPFCHLDRLDDDYVLEAAATTGCSYVGIEDEEVVEEMEEEEEEGEGEQQQTVEEEAADLRRQLLQQQCAKISHVVSQVSPPAAPHLPAQAAATVARTVDSVDKLLERCKFWPNCRSGSQCVYMHPTEPCTAFPRCALGNRCVYVHPPCKFQRSCTKPDCPFTHSVARASVTSSASTGNACAVECRFKNNCRNVGCEFVHPPACRYGSVCVNPACGFTHPSSAVAAAAPAGGYTRQQYRWVSKAA